MRLRQDLDLLPAILAISMACDGTHVSGPSPNPSPIWVKEISFRAFPTGLKTDNERVYFADGSGISAVDVAGQVVWEDNTTGLGLIGSSFIIANDVVVAGYNGLVALRAQTGERLWTVEGSIPDRTTVDRVGRLFIWDSELLTAFDIQTGIELWETALEQGGLVRLGAGGGLVCAVRPVFRNARVECFSTTTGIRHWTRLLGSAEWIAVDEDLVILAGGESEGELGWIGLNPETGATIWTSSHDLPSRGPAISDSGIIYACGNMSEARTDCAAVQAGDGSIIWQTNLPDIPVGAPAAGQESLYIVAGDETFQQFLYVLDLTTGQIDMRLTTDEEVRGFCGSPMTINNLVFAFGCAGFLLAYQDI